MKTTSHVRKASVAPYLTFLVHLGFYSKTPYTGWLVKNRSLFLIALEAGSPGTRQGFTAGETSVPGLHTATFSPSAYITFPWCVQRAESDSLESLLIMSLNLLP